MSTAFQPWTLLVVTVAGWIQREQQLAIEYLLEENRVLKARLRGKRLRFTDDERRRLAAKGKVLSAHWDTVAATDFFTVEVTMFRRLVTYYVLFVIELSSRKVQIAGITPGPDSAFMMQVGRNLTDPVDGFLLDKRFLILDRDNKFTTDLRNLIEHSGTNVIRLPHRSPNLNAYAERFVLSIKSECLDRMTFYGERSLRRAVADLFVIIMESASIKVWTTS